MLVETVAATACRHKMFARGPRVGVAVSGGADSVCLLHVLHELAPRWNLELSVLHVNHRLRGAESDADENYVRELGARLGLAVHCHSEDVRGISLNEGDNLEQTGRRVRREFFLSFLEAGSLNQVALGHTLSDQAETVLFRFLRGSGTAGLAAMRPVTPEGLVRPLIEVERSQVESFLRERGISWREDASNRDPVFARNRIRHGLLPALVRDWNPSIASTLAATARIAQDEEDYWAGIVGELASTHLTIRGPAVLVRGATLLAFPRAVARRLVRRALEMVRGNLRGIDFPHVEQVLALAASSEGSGRFQAPGIDVFRSFDWIRFAPPGLESPEDRNYRLAVSVPGTYRVPGTRTRVVLEVLERDARQAEGAKTLTSGYNDEESALDWVRISGMLELRNWRPGDQYRPVGHASETKIKSLFQDSRVPLWDRRKWPVLVSGDRILWAARFGPAADLRATPESRTLLRIREIDESTQSL